MFANERSCGNDFGDVISMSLNFRDVATMFQLKMVTIHHEALLSKLCPLGHVTTTHHSMGVWNNFANIDENLMDHFWNSSKVSTGHVRALDWLHHFRPSMTC